MDLKGKIHQQKYSGFNACIIQHEIDHLNGVLFIDKLIKEEKKKKAMFALELARVFDAKLEQVKVPEHISNMLTWLFMGDD